MTNAYICDAVRTPIGRYAGALSSVRTDDLAAIPLRALKERNAKIDWDALDDIIMGCANQAGEDNRNVARMAALLAGIGERAPGTTVNRLCGSGMDAVTIAARAIKAGEADLIIAGGVESMSRAPFVMGKASEAFSRNAEIFDTTIGWRFVNPVLKAQYGIDSMPETAENVAADFAVARGDQDAFAYRSQMRASAAQKNGRLAAEIVPVTIPQRKGDPIVVSKDEHPRETTLEALAALKPFVKKDGVITAGNASGVNDGAAALIVASEAAVKKYGLTPRARFVAGAVVGVLPAHHGDRPRARLESGSRQGEIVRRRYVGDRVQRSLRGASARLLARAWASRRRRAREPQWRRDRARPSPWHVRRAAPFDRDRRTPAPQGPLRPLRHVHRRRAGHRECH